MPIARAVPAKFKAFLFPVIKKLFRYSVIPLFHILQRPDFFVLVFNFPLSTGVLDLKFFETVSQRGYNRTLKK